MEIYKLLLFIPACFALNMAPGPNNLLSMNNGRCYGFQIAVIAGLGRIVAFAVMIALAASGLAVILYASETVFFIIKVLGAAYLLWLAIQLWQSELPLTSTSNKARSDLYKPSYSYFGLAQQEFLLAAGNPKAILIFTAFLPQFVNTTQNINEQFFILGITFLLLEIIAISLYALFGLYLQQWLTQPAMARRFNRACAGFLAFSGANLLFIRQQ